MPPIKVIRSGQVLFNEGDTPNSLFIVQKGALSIRKKRGSNFVEVGKILSGEIIGELSFFDHQPRSATAIAIMDTEVLEITFESLERIYTSVPPYMRTIVASMADRLRKTNDIIRNLEKKTTPVDPE